MLKILVVEDNPHNMRLMEQLFEDIAQAGLDQEIELLQASSGEAALQVAELNQIALVLMDISLPGMGGLEITAKMKTYAWLKNTPFIAVTAYAMKEDEAKLRHIFDDYISKPIDEEVFTEKITAWIRRIM